MEVISQVLIFILVGLSTNLIEKVAPQNPDDQNSDLPANVSFSLKPLNLSICEKIGDLYNSSKDYIKSACFTSVFTPRNEAELLAAEHGMYLYGITTLDEFRSVNIFMLSAMTSTMDIMSLVKINGYLSKKDSKYYVLNPKRSSLYYRAIPKVRNSEGECLVLKHNPTENRFQTKENSCFTFTNYLLLEFVNVLPGEK